MKKTRFIILTAAVAFALAGVTGLTDQVSAATVVAKNIDPVAPELRSLKTKYNSAKKSVTISGLATKGKKVVVKYGNKKVKTTSVKNGAFKTSVKFTGYKTFSLYAADKKGKKVTPTKKISAAKYAAKKPVVIKTVRTKKGLTVTLATQPNGLVSLYYAGKKISNKKTTSAKTKIFISAKTLKNKKGYFTVKQFQKNKKASQSAKIEINKVGIVSVVNY